LSAFDFFDRCYCIHLPNPQRRVTIEAQFKRVGITDVQYVHADRPPPQFEMSNMRRCGRGEFGVNLSQIKAVVQAIADGAERPLFVEDDIVFDAAAMPAELPPDWDVIYLGGHPRGKVERVSQGLVRVGKFSCAEAYALRRGVLMEFFGYWCNRISKPEAMFDFVLGEFAELHRAYCVYPLVCEQVVGVSQISGKVDDKRKIVARGWVNNLGREYATAAHIARSTT
jgi:hypothetical protein